MIAKNSCVRVKLDRSMRSPIVSSHRAARSSSGCNPVQAPVTAACTRSVSEKRRIIVRNAESSSSSTRSAVRPTSAGPATWHIVRSGETALPRKADEPAIPSVPTVATSTLRPSGVSDTMLMIESVGKTSSWMGSQGATRVSPCSRSRSSERADDPLEVGSETGWRATDWHLPHPRIRATRETTSSGRAGVAPRTRYGCPGALAPQMHDRSRRPDATPGGRRSGGSVSEQRGQLDLRLSELIAGRGISGPGDLFGHPVEHLDAALDGSPDLAIARYQARRSGPRRHHDDVDAPLQACIVHLCSISTLRTQRVESWASGATRPTVRARWQPACTEPTP